MMQDSKLSKWAVLGALHFDISAELDREWFLSSSDTQTWVDWKLEIGGVGGNIARYLAEMGASVELIAVVGRDRLGTLLVEEFARSTSGINIHAIAGEGAATGLVNLLYIREEHDRHRLVLGPEKSAIDVVAYDNVKHTLDALRPDTCDLIVDGYLMRTEPTRWLDGIKQLRSQGWRIHLELVPHNSWRSLTEAMFVELARTCTTVSSSLHTIERIIGLQPDDSAAPRERALRLVRSLTQLPKDAAQVVARFGHKDAEFCTILPGGSPPELWQYDRALISGRKGSQDRLFAMELMGLTELAGAARLAL